VSSITETAIREHKGDYGIAVPLGGFAKIDEVLEHLRGHL
jgi:hypothetical protein